MRVLLIKLSSIGDIVMASPAAQAVKRAFPDAHVTWAVDSRFSELVLGNPHVDDVLTWRRFPGLAGGVVEPWRLGREVRRRRFDVVIDLQGNARSGFLTHWSGATRRIGYERAREMARTAYNERIACADFPHGMACHVGLLRAFSPDAEFQHSAMFVPISDEDRQFAAEFVRTEIGEGASFAAFFPATTRPNKHWPAAYWSELAELVQKDLGLTPLLLGSPADDALAKMILSSVRGRTVSAVGGTTLLQASALIERSSLAIGVDTGLLHIAVALNRPTVGIFGPTDAWRNHAHLGSFRAVYEPMECAPCRRRPTCEDFHCMKAISPERVVAAAGDAANVAGVRA